MAARSAHASLDPDGTGCLTVTGEAGRVAAAMGARDSPALRGEATRER